MIVPFRLNRTRVPHGTKKIRADCQWIPDHRVGLSDAHGGFGIRLAAGVDRGQSDLFWLNRVLWLGCNLQAMHLQPEGHEVRESRTFKRKCFACLLIHRPWLVALPENGAHFLAPAFVSVSCLARVNAKAHGCEAGLVSMPGRRESI